MAWKGGFDRSFSVPEFRAYVASLKWGAWKPKFITLHHTGAPSLAQWLATPVPGVPNPTMQLREAQRMKNLEHYYKNQMGWSSGPHLFIGERIHLGTPLTVAGTHAVSFNSNSIGIEMAGNYDVEHLGGIVYDNTIAALAILHEVLGIDPETLKFHRDDPKTTKTCPGKNVAKADIIKAVRAAMAKPAVVPPKTAPAPTQDYYAQPGDTLWSLAKKLAKAVADLVRWNPGTLKVGQKVITEEPPKYANKLSHEGAGFIAREEGVVLTTYMDGATPAIGMGHNDARLKMGETISLEFAIKLFEQDVVKFTTGVLKVLTKPVLQHELDALVSLSYNIGLGNFGRSSVVANFNAGDKAKAAESFLLWHKASGKADVLLGRRQRERDLFLTGNYGKLDAISVWEGDPKTTKPKKMALPK